MKFITEEDVRERCRQNGGSFALAVDERLTPSAREYADSMRVTVSQGGCAPCADGSKSAVKNTPKAAGGKQPGGVSAQPSASMRQFPGMTWLTPAVQVPKTDQRIVLRGKLDSLLSTVILVQTQFDPKDRLPGFLKDCLNDIKNWVLQVLAAEIGGEEPDISGMGGMDAATLHTVSLDPERYLKTGHCMADASLGGNVALLNWLRALARETEIEALRCLPADGGTCVALNRLSSALYVLMLLAMSGAKSASVKLG